VLKNSIFIISVLYTLVLLSLCLMSLNNLPKVTLNHADKIFHLSAYFIFTVLWSFTFLLKFSFKIKRSILLATAFAILFGIFIEVLQGTYTSSRSFDYYDVLANTLGALIATIVLKIIATKYQKI